MTINLESVEFDFVVCSTRLMPIAEELISKYDELSHIDPKRILFVANMTGRDKKVKLAKTSRITVRWIDLLNQLGNASYSHMMEFYAKTTAAMDESQLVALVYRELRKIGPEGEILTYDVQDWWQILMGLGRQWFYPDQTCPNLLDDNINWNKLISGFNKEVAG